MSEANKVELIIDAKSRLTLRRAIALTICGLLLGGVTTKLYDLAKEPPAVTIDKSPQLAKFGNYVGIIFDRTRNSWCELHPSRILFTNSVIDGFSMPVVYPLPTPAFVWPKLGHEKLLVLLNTIPSDLPPGRWYIQSMAFEHCHWYSFLTGQHFIVSKPLAIEIGSHAQNHDE